MLQQSPAPPRCPSRSSLARAAGPTPGISRRSPAKDDHAQGARAPRGCLPSGPALLREISSPPYRWLRRAATSLCFSRRSGVQDRAHFDRSRRHRLEHPLDHALLSLCLPPHLFDGAYDSVLEGEEGLHVEQPADECLRLSDPAVLLKILQCIDDEIDPDRGNPLGAAGRGSPAYSFLP